MSESRVVNINVAGEAEIAQIAELGIQRARKIIEYRAKFGRFKTIEDLSKVPGIDVQILQDIRASVTV
jgi:competence protein ComEA